MSSNRRADASRRKKGIYTRAELIKKHGLATFHPDPEENRKLQETKGKDIDFTGEYTNSDGSQVKRSKFLPDSKTAGSTAKKKLQTRKSNIKPRLGYPLARGPGEMTGDTLLIKCLEYVAPQNGTGLGIGFDKTTQKVTQGGVLNGRKYKTGDTYTKYSNFRLNANDANSRMSRNQKIKYYVELPIPQEVNDSNIVTWGDDTMNIFQLAGVAAATAVMENPNKSFQNFITGNSNKLAYEASLKVSESSAQYNPLYIYGGVGMGKTHLLNAVGFELKKKKKVMFIPAERFMYQFIKSIKANDMVKFKEYFRNTDILLIDDIQFMNGKEAMQEEFFHTFNALLEKGGQIILSADRPPNKLSRIQERIKSRFSGGLVVDIQKPDFCLLYTSDAADE